MLVQTALLAGLVLLTGLGGVLFGFAFRDVGAIQPSFAFAMRWALNPFILAALAAGLGARFLYYGSLRYLNVSQVTLFSALGIVATLVLARVLLDERLTRTELAGSALVVVGVALIGR